MHHRTPGTSARSEPNVSAAGGALRLWRIFRSRSSVALAKQTRRRQSDQPCAVSAEPRLPGHFCAIRGQTARVRLPEPIPGLVACCTDAAHSERGDGGIHGSPFRHGCYSLQPGIHDHGYARGPAASLDATIRGRQIKRRATAGLALDRNIVARGDNAHKPETGGMSAACRDDLTREHNAIPCDLIVVAWFQGDH